MTDLPPTSTSPAPDCERLRELLPAYSIGAADPDEARFVEATLPLCPEVSPELREYAQAAQVLYSRVPRAQRPAGMQARFLERLAAETGGDSAASASAPPTVVALPRQPGVGRAVRQLTLTWGGLAALLILFTLSNLYWIAQVNSARGELNALTGTAYRTVRLAATEADAFSAAVVWLPGAERALLVTENLPALAPDQTYQLWLIQGEAALSAGVFDAAQARSYEFAPPQPLDAVDALAISTEPAGGSPAPTTPPIAVGSLAEL